MSAIVAPANEPNYFEILAKNVSVDQGYSLCYNFTLPKQKTDWKAAVFTFWYLKPHEFDL
jgi:hypothetical protein